jgi:hypothetical protein
MSGAEFAALVRTLPEAQQRKIEPWSICFWRSRTNEAPTPIDEKA